MGWLGRTFWGLVLIVPWLLVTRAATASTNSLPDSDFIVERFIERLKAGNSKQSTNHYQYHRYTLFQELNRHGETNKNHLLTHLVVVQNGDEKATLEKVDNRTPTHKELKADAEDNAPPSDKDRKGHQDEETDGITEEVVRCFHYQVVGTEMCQGRNAYCVVFQPIKGKKLSKSQKYLSALAGKAWVDSSDYEPIKIEAQLKEPIELLGGIAGAIKHFEILIQRRRLNETIWDNDLVEGHFELRKLFTTSRGHFQVRQEDFQLLSP